jgi:hypothetical protein
MEITLSTSGTSESLSVLKYGWTIKDYIRELAAGCYFVIEYFDIAINEIKLQGMINLTDQENYYNLNRTIQEINFTKELLCQ